MRSSNLAPVHALLLRADCSPLSRTQKTNLRVHVGTATFTTTHCWKERKEQGGETLTIKKQ